MSKSRHRRPSLLAAAGLVVLFGGVAVFAGWAPNPRNPQTQQVKPEEIERRRARIEAMSPAAKKDLLERKEQFDALLEGEQNRLRRIHAKISADPQADRLRKVLSGYAAWLNSLPLEHRMELRRLKREERIEGIKRLHVEQDVKTTFRWLEEYAALHKDDILNGAQGLLKPDIARVALAQRRKVLAGLMVRRWFHEGEPVQPEIEPEAFGRLVNSLSNMTRRHIDTSAAVQTQWRKLVETLTGSLADHAPERMRDEIAGLNAPQKWALLWRKYTARTIDRGGPPSERALMRFLHDEIPQRMRKRLENLPRDELLRELRRLWRKSSRQHPGEGRPRREPFDDRHRGAKPRIGPDDRRQFQDRRERPARKGSFRPPPHPNDQQAPGKEPPPSKPEP